MKKLTLRMKLALLITLAITLILGLFAFAFYVALKPAMENQVAARCIAEAIRIAGEVEYDEVNGVIMEDDFKSFESPYFSVSDLEGRIIERNHMLLWIDGLALQPDMPRKVSQDGTQWMIYDFRATEDGETVAYVRVSEKLNAIPDATRQMLALFAILLPIGCVLALLAGLGIARRALSPIAEMINAAADITKGDLSRRVAAPETNDEVGNLAVTFNKMIASMQNAMERERQFTSDASHELRTPLAVILANAALALLEDASDAERKEALEIIMQKGNHMQAMLSQLLMLARGTEQAQALEFSALNLSEIAEDIVETCRLTADNRKIRIHVDCKTQVTVQADLLLLTRAMLNLIENAIKYGKEGGNIWVSTKKSNDHVIFSVRDDGIGIPSEHLSHVFERFYQADSARSEGGSGLGLAIVKYIADLHSGGVYVKSNAGEGTEFVLRLPVNGTL